MHLAVQLLVMNLYYDYSHIMLSLCQKSQFSLCSPYKISTMFYGKDIQIDNDDDSIKFCSNYFEYGKYNFLYKFFNSSQIFMPNNYT